MNSAKYVKVDSTLEKVADAAKTRLIEDHNIQFLKVKQLQHLLMYF